MYAHWNYRVIRSPEGRLGVCEVYYDESGRPEAWSDPVSLSADSFEDLTVEVECFSLALHKPVMCEKIVDGKSVLVDDV